MKLIFERYLINDDGGRNRQQNAISNTKIESVHWNLFADLDEPLCLVHVSFSSCQRNLIKTFQIEGMIALIAKMDMIFSSDLLNGKK